jgi:hypothetical protein
VHRSLRGGNRRRCPNRKVPPSAKRRQETRCGGWTVNETLPVATTLKGLNGAQNGTTLGRSSAKPKSCNGPNWSTLWFPKRPVASALQKMRQQNQLGV